MLEIQSAYLTPVTGSTISLVAVHDRVFAIFRGSRDDICTTSTRLITVIVCIALRQIQLYAEQVSLDIHMDCHGDWTLAVICTFAEVKQFINGRRYYADK